MDIAVELVDGVDKDQFSEMILCFCQDVGSNRPQKSELLSGALGSIVVQVVST